MMWLSKMHVAPTVLALGALLGAGLPASGEDAPKAQKAPEHKTTQSKSYIMVDPIYATIVADNRPAGMLMVGVGLDVPTRNCTRKSAAPCRCCATPIFAT